MLPFANLSNDPAQDYFADGITENLTTDLSRIRNSFVIARNTAFTFKGKTLDAKEIGKELGVRYVLEGSVQRDQNRRARQRAAHRRANPARISGPTASRRTSPTCSSCRIRWSRDLANSLGYELVKAEAAKGARSTNPDAIDLVMRGLALLNEQYSSPARRGTIRRGLLFEQALAIDPNNAAAVAGLGYTYVGELHLWMRQMPGTDYDAKILGQADRAIALAPDYDLPYDAKGAYLALSCAVVTKRLRALNAGLAVNPNNPSFYLTERARKYRSAVSTRRNPTCNRRFG